MWMTGNSEEGIDGQSSWLVYTISLINLEYYEFKFMLYKFLLNTVRTRVYHRITNNCDYYMFIIVCR